MVYRHEEEPLGRLKLAWSLWRGFGTMRGYLWFHPIKPLSTFFHKENLFMAVERTLSIIKPDAVAKNVIGKIYSRFGDQRAESDRCQDGLAVGTGSW